MQLFCFKEEDMIFFHIYILNSLKIIFWLKWGINQITINLILVKWCTFNQYQATESMGWLSLKSIVDNPSFNVVIGGRI